MVQSVSAIVIQCRPPLALSDGRLMLGLDQPQYDHLHAVIWRYYRSLWGTLDPWSSGVGKATDYNRVNSKRHKPESMPPPRAADPDEPDWHNSRLAAAIESLTPTEQSIVRMKVSDRFTNRAIGDEVGRSERWVIGRWGTLATWLYFRERGLVE